MQLPSAAHIAHGERSYLDVETVQEFLEQHN